MNIQHFTRRDFMKVTGLSVSGLLLGFRAEAKNSDTGKGFQPNAFIAIGSDGSVSLSIGVPEIGQNIRTTFAMILADELGADLSKVSLLQAPPRGDMDRQTAGGSGSVRRMFLPLREAAATAREMLIQGTAQKMGISPNDCITEKGFVIIKSGQKIPFSEASEYAQSVDIPTGPTLKPHSEFKYIGKSERSLDAREIANGKMNYGIDVLPENTGFAVILRSPVYLGTMISFEAEEAKQMPGVKDIVALGNKVAVIADNTWQAINASRKVKVTWDGGQHADLDSEALDKFRENAVKSAKKISTKRGEFEPAFDSAPVKIEQNFFIPIITHATLEPPNCTAWVKDDGIEIWGSTQVLNKLYKELPSWTGFPHEKITYHQMRIGGGFGRKLATDYIEETLELAQKVSYPVKMIFTREDDIQKGKYRRPDYFEYRVGLANNGFPEAIEEVSAFKPRGKRPTHMLGFFTTALRKFNSVSPGINGGALRAPNHNVTCFADQSLISIMAEAVKVDPIEYQLALHGDPTSLEKLEWKESPRDRPELCALLRTVQKMSSWKQDPDLGYGVATFSGYGSHCALVAVVKKNGATRPIEKVFAAVDCGQVINRLGAYAQIEGGIIDCLSATLDQKITIRDGRVQQSNFHDYKLLRMAESPDVEISIAESNAEPQGLGEVSYPPMAPATANAIYDATGIRHSHLPIRS